VISESFSKSAIKCILYFVFCILCYFSKVIVAQLSVQCAQDDNNVSSTDRQRVDSTPSLY